MSTYVLVVPVASLFPIQSGDSEELSVRKCLSSLDLNTWAPLVS